MGEIREQTLLKLSEKKRSGRNGKEDKVILRVVQWNNYRPSLEKREFWKDGSQWKSGKCKGLNIDDLHLIADNWEEIVEILEGHEEEKEEKRPRRARSSSTKASSTRSSTRASSNRTSKKKSKARGKRRRSVVTYDDNDTDADDSDDNGSDADDSDDFDDFEDYDD